MLLSGCGNAQAVRRGMPLWLFLLLCDLGMFLGMLAVELWQPLLTSGMLRELAVIMVRQMLLAMAVGMGGVWWIAERVYGRAVIGAALLTEGGK